MKRNPLGSLRHRRCGYCARVIRPTRCANPVCVAIERFHASPSRFTRAKYRHRGGPLVYLREMAEFLRSTSAKEGK